MAVGMKAEARHLTGVSLHIFRMNAEGGNLQQLTDSSAWDEFAVWIG